MNWKFIIIIIILANCYYLVFVFVLYFNLFSRNAASKNWNVRYEFLNCFHILFYYFQFAKQNAGSNEPLSPYIPIKSE